MNFDHATSTPQANIAAQNAVYKFKTLLFQQANILAKIECVDYIEEKHIKEAWKILCNKKL